MTGAFQTTKSGRAALLKAVFVFFGALVFFFWVFNNGWAFRHFIAPYTSLVAFVAASIFRLFGQAALQAGTIVTVNGNPLSIATGCNGAEAMALYFSAILAFPTEWRQKLVGLILGLVGIFTINQVRVIGLFIVAMVKPEILPEAHNYAGQTFVIVMGMALWWFWAERFTGAGNAKNAEDGR
ncbi:MAG TPA: exosortase H [Verrucomicrobiae bacterium]|nr:exosortase H [Verrucomicrobiae bacterium]